MGVVSGNVVSHFPSRSTVEDGTVKALQKQKCSQNTRYQNQGKSKCVEMAINGRNENQNQTSFYHS